ncbi:hypothetical protein JMJ35_009525 [Cladonia borealis]|uniref:Rhomboid family membrane protein n=1 Tax=Cladonia borealis TaxID=184061 RepID=A0AA39QTL0_9LECA|nr:hypothetical protein JMJ35_009525 [Cladonia borealis]
MSQPTTTTTSPSPPNPTTTHPYRPIFLTLLLACPVLALLPPRKLDLYTFTLSGAWVYSATELAYSHPRRVRLQYQAQAMMRDAGVGEDEMEEGKGRGLRSEATEESLGDGNGEIEDGGVRGLLRKAWMGDEKAGWQKRRLEREREELESGKGYGDLIMEQVREVFPRFGGGGRGRGEEDENENGGEEGGG